MTNFERITTHLRTVQGLAAFMLEHDLDVPYNYCRERPECLELLDTDEGVPTERCRQCLVDWLQAAETKLQEATT